MHGSAHIYHREQAGKKEDEKMADRRWRPRGTAAHLDRDQKKNAQQ
jgi:hypothetical protein